MTRFAEGATAVRRDVLDGRIWTAHPHRVVRDTSAELVLACWPGVVLRSPTTWIEWLQTGDTALREQAIPNLAARRWELGDWTWRDTTTLSRYVAGEGFSVHRFFAADGRCGGWYVNFERPAVRTRIGVDTFDLLLDLLVEPDLSSWTWKDEDEYAQGRRLGLITDALHAEVDLARQQVLAMVTAAQGPFAQNWTGWRRDPGWSLPVLPDDALTLPSPY